MIRRKGPILATAVVVAFALGWYRGLFGIGPTEENVAPVGQKPAEQGSGVARVDRPQAGSPPSAEAAKDNGPSGMPPVALAGAPSPPGFDVVRVEPDGSAVVAGKGVANQSIALTDGTQTLGEAQTDANGDFVMSLSIPEGSHRLQLAQRDDVVSDEAAVINVPPAGRPDQLLVMVQRPGEASEVLRRPQDTNAAPEAPRSKAVEQMAAIQPAAPAPAPEAAQPTKRADVSVEAVEIEGDQLFVAGSAPAGSKVRIYLDDQFVTDAPGSAGDRFIAQSAIEVPVGEHRVRADLVDEAGRVLGRVEVPFQRQEGPSMAAVAAPQSEPAQRAEETPNASSAAETVSPPESSSIAAAEVPAAVPSSVGGNDESGGTGGPSLVVQAPLQASPSRVIIRRGDTLWRISRDTYGRGSRYTVIYLANGDQIRDPNRIYPGQVFRMPDEADEQTTPRG